MKIYSENEREVVQALVKLERENPDKYTNLMLSVWRDAADFVDSVAECVKRGTSLQFKDGPIFTLADMFSETGIDRMTYPCDIQRFVHYVGLMNHLTVDGERRFSEVVRAYDDAWENLFTAICTRYPVLAPKCVEIAENRSAVTACFVDLYRGRRRPALTVRWYKQYCDLRSGLGALKCELNATPKGAQT